MSVIDGPNLVGGSITDLVVPCQYDHGPWEYSGSLYTASKTNDNRGFTVFGGTGFIYYASAFDGPPHWTRATSGYPASNINYFWPSCQPHKVDSQIFCLTYNTSNSKNAIGQFDCSSRTYASPGAEATLSLSTVNPIAVRHLSNGDVLALGTGTGGAAGFYRYKSGAWGSFVTISTSAKIIAVVDDDTNPVAHVLYWNTSSGDLSYRKIFDDNSMTDGMLVQSAFYYSFFGMSANQPYGNSYEFFESQLYVAFNSSHSGNCLISSPLDATVDNPTFAAYGGFSSPASSDPEGFGSFGQGGVAVANGELYLILPTLTYDTDGGVLTDQIYSAHWNGTEFEAFGVAADFQANPPTAEPGDTLPDSSSQYSHFHSVHGFSDGNLGTVCDFLDDVGGCTSYYAHFAASAGEDETPPEGGGVTETPVDDFGTGLADSILLAAGFGPGETLPLLDNSVAILSLRKSFGDGLVFTDIQSQVSHAISSGLPSTTGGTGDFQSGGGVNSAQFCVFEFYEMEQPEQVEVLPVPKKYDQLGPMRFDKVAKIFGFRVRLIMNGTTEIMPYQIFGDDSPTAKPGYSQLLYQGSFLVRPGTDYVYEIQLPKSVNSDIVRLVLGPTGDSFHRYDVVMKIQQSGMGSQSKWITIR